MKTLLLLPLLLLPMAGFAQTVEPEIIELPQPVLPEYAYETVAEITMATTAANSCQGAKLKERRMQNALVALMTQLAADGLDPTVSMQHFGTEDGQALIAMREDSLRARHGVAVEGADALCEAIRAELKTNKSLAQILRLR